MNKKGNSLQKHEKNRFMSKLCCCCCFFFFFFPQKKEVILTHFIKRGGIEKSLCKYTGKNSLHENPFCECVEEKKCLCMKKYIAFIGLQHSLNLSCGSQQNTLKPLCFIHKQIRVYGSVQMTLQLPKVRTYIWAITMKQLVRTTDYQQTLTTW